MRFILKITTANFDGVDQEELKAAIELAVEAGLKRVKSAVNTESNRLATLKREAEALIARLQTKTTVSITVDKEDPQVVRPTDAGRLLQRNNNPPPDTGEVDEGQQKILNTLAMLHNRGLTPNSKMLARWHAKSDRCGLHPTGGTYLQNLAKLRKGGYIINGYELSDIGQQQARPVAGGLEECCKTVTASQENVIRVLEAGPQENSKTLAAALGLHPTGGTYLQGLARLRVMGIIPERGTIKLTEAVYK